MKGFISVVAAVACCLASTASAQVEIVDREAVSISGGQPVVRTLRFADLHELRPASHRIVSDIALGDVDGDGDLDAFYAHGNSFFFPIREPNGLLLNDGTARFHRADYLLPGESEITSAARLDDLEGDGDLDLITRDYEIGVRVYLNDGDARFTENPGVLPFLHDFGFELADVDGDRDLDLYIASDEQDQLFVNDGSPYFDDESFRLPDDPFPSGRAAFGDLDGDDDLDILLGGSAGGTARLYLNDGSGYFSIAAGRLPRADPHFFQLADVDGDDDLDALTTTVLYLNDGSGTFTDATHQLHPSPYSNNFFLADVEGDGDVDILGFERLLYLNDGHGKFTNASFLLPSRDDWRPMAFGDLDADGDVDALTAYFYLDYLYRRFVGEGMLLGDGTGAFVDVEALTDEIAERPMVASVLIDMDDDGDLDAVTGASLDGPGGTREQKTFLFHNDGYGKFADHSERFPWIDGLVKDMGVADFDGDGDQDVVRAQFINWDGAGGGLLIHFNQGDGSYDNWGRIPFSGEFAQALDLGDVDHDGDVDILVGQSNTLHFFVDRLCLNDGAAGFISAPGFPEEDQPASLVRLVDVNGDTHLDALMVGAEAHLYVNDGNAVFTEVPLPFPHGVALDVADVDGDGDVDLLVAAQEDYSLPDEVTLYRNDGSGLFVPDPQSFASRAEQRVAAVALQDVDEDGDPDAFVDNDFYRNTGTGTFRYEAGALPRGLAVYGASFGDVDGDDDVDLLSSGRIWTNLSRQVSWATLPRIGQPLRMSIYGPANTPFVLAFSPDPAILAGAREGVHIYDPSLLVIVGTGQLSAKGTASVVKDVPDDLALVGKCYFWQAVVGNPLRFTNVEWTTLLDL